MTFRPRDFESRASTNFTTPAELLSLICMPAYVKKILLTIRNKDFDQE